MFKTAFRHLSRNSWLSLASIAVITLTFFLSTLFAGLLYGSNILLNYFETQAQVIAFFKVGTEETEILDVKRRIEKYLAPENVEYTSEEAALAEFKDAFKDDEIILESITENVLPASLGIRAKSLDDIPQLVNFLDDEKEKNEQIEEIFYREDVVDRIKQISRIIRVAGLSLVAFLGIVSFLIILITIGITISSYRPELEIMQLVGASKSYIRWPFIITGSIYGALGALFALLIISGMIYTAVYYLETTELSQVIFSFFGGVKFPEITIRGILAIFGVETGLGILIGAFSSIIAVFKQLK